MLADRFEVADRHVNIVDRSYLAQPAYSYEGFGFDEDEASAYLKTEILPD
jgi:hypothetical protein